MTIRICTWNIGGGLVRSNRNIFEVEDIGYFLRVLTEIDPDIVCIQEAHSSLDAREDQLALLATRLGLPHVVSHILSPSHLKPATDAGIGVASRYRVIEKRFLPLPNPKWTGRGPDGSEWRTFDKGFLTLVLDAVDRDICLVTGHDFPFRAFSRSEKDPELLAIHGDLNALLLHAAEEFPTLFAADLNVQQPSQCLPVLREPEFRRVIPSGPTTQPWGMQFDHIYASAHFRTQASGVVSGEADHFLCWADLELEG